jgi:hypothetical protein
LSFGVVPIEIHLTAAQDLRRIQICGSLGWEKPEDHSNRRGASDGDQRHRLVELDWPAKC